MTSVKETITIVAGVKRQQVIGPLALTVFFLLGSLALAQQPNRQDTTSAHTDAGASDAADSPTWVHSDLEITELPRVSAKQLLGGQKPATSFEALQSILKPGHKVTFAGHRPSRFPSVLQAGGLRSGREVTVAEITPDHVVLVRKSLWRTQQITLTERDLRRIDISDPILRGGVLGAVVGVSLGLALVLETHREGRSKDCNLCPLGHLIGATLPIAGAVVGESIDRAISEPVYEVPPRRRIALEPIASPHMVGASAVIRF